MADFFQEDALYTSRWKRAFLWNFFLLGLLTPFFVVLGHHLSQQPNPVTKTKGKGYKSGGIASFAAVVATYVLLAIAMPMLTGMSVGQAARAGADTAGRGWRAAGEWVSSLWTKPPDNNAAALAAEKARNETEAREKADADERQRVLAEQHAAEDRVAKELEQKRRQAEAAIVAPRENPPNEHANEEQAELARFDAEQKRKKSEQDARSAAQSARVDAQTALEQREAADLSARKARAIVRAREGELTTAQQRVAALDSMQPRPANYAQLHKLYHDAEESAKAKVSEVRTAAHAADRDFIRPQSAEVSARSKAESFGPIELPKGAAKPPPGPVISIYRLKDGREISTVKVVDFGDAYGLKDEAGKVTTVKKTEVWDVREP